MGDARDGVRRADTCRWRRGPPPLPAARAGCTVSAHTAVAMTGDTAVEMMIGRAAVAMTVRGDTAVAMTGDTAVMEGHGRSGDYGAL